MSRSAVHSMQGRAAPANVRALVFDMGDVLYDATLWRRWLWQALGRAGFALGYRELFEIWDRDFLNEVHCGRGEYFAAFDSFLRSLGLSRGLVEEIEAASHAKRRELAVGLRPLPGVKQTLHRLNLAQFPLAVLSDSESPARELAQRLDRLDIGRCFQAVVSSCELGCTKPDTECYAAALAAIDVEPSEAGFVGHDAEELAGAQAAGMTAIAFSHDADVQADWRLDRFDKLLELLPGPAVGAMAG